jgi:hypothetical protein
MRVYIDTVTALRGMEALSADWYNVPRANRSALASTGNELRLLLYRSRKELAAINPHSPVLSLAMKRAWAPPHRNAGGWVYKYEGRGKKRKRLKHFQRVGSAHHGTGFASDDNAPAFRRAVKAIRYQVEGDNAVRIGFYRGSTGQIDFALSELIARQAEAKDFPISKKMRRFLFSAGMPVRSGTVLHRPARDWLNKTLEANREKLQGHFAEKFYAALQRYRG